MGQRSFFWRTFFVCFFLLVVRFAAFASGIRLEDFPYPYLVHIFKFSSQQQTLEMAYMDVQPENPNGQSAVLLHGKNFSGAYWGPTAEALRQKGFRVIIPDQIGFGKSSKPQNYQFTFQQLAFNTHALLTNSGIMSAHIIGHSMGGMIATRYALMFPSETKTLILPDPIGLEDWKAKGVPYATLDQDYQTELKQTPEKIRDYEKQNYYHGTWKPEYEQWVQMLADFKSSPEYSDMAWDQALTTDFTQPVCYEFQNLKVPVLLMVGQLDRTAIGKERAPEAVRKTLGQYPELGRQVVAEISGAKLIEINGAGHLPMVEAFPKFMAAVQTFMETH